MEVFPAIVRSGLHRSKFRLSTSTLAIHRFTGRFSRPGAIGGSVLHRAVLSPTTVATNAPRGAPVNARRSFRQCLHAHQERKRRNRGASTEGETMFDTTVCLVGNVITEPEWRRTTVTGTFVATFRFASTSRRFDKTT